MQVMEAAIGTMIIWTEAMIATEIEWKTAAMTAMYVASTMISMTVTIVTMTERMPTARATTALV